MKLSILLLAAAQQVWNQWRGPNRDGISPDTGLVKEWPREGPPLAWKATGVGGGFASVSFSGNLIFTLGDFPDACSLVALQSDGKVAWKVEVGPAGKADHPGVRSTPSTDGKLVFALGDSGNLVAVEIQSQMVVWRKNLEKDLGGKRPGWWYSESPLLDGNLVVVTPGGKNGAVAALDKATGQKAWQSSEFKDGAQYASLVPTEIGGARQYVVLTMQSVAGIAAKDGKLLWRADRQGRTAVVATPVVKDGHVFVTSGYGVGCDAFKVSAAGSGDFKVEEAYSDKENRDSKNKKGGPKKLANHHGGVILVGEHIYGVDDGGSIKCIEFKTGKEVWAGPRLGKGSIAYADGLIVYRSENKRTGTIALVEASPQGYREKGKFNPPDLSGEMTWPHPVIFGGKLYIRDQDTLLAYNLRAG